MGCRYQVPFAFFVMFDLADYLARAFNSNYSEFPNSWTSLQFPVHLDALQMFVDGGNGNLKQRPNQRLRQPNRLALKTAFNPSLAVRG
jgi:hypothetical protein